MSRGKREDAPIRPACYALPALQWCAVGLQEAEKAQLQAEAEAEEAAQRLLEWGGPGSCSGGPLLALPAPGACESGA